MQIRFLLGPAGSGKTHRCLGEIRSELASAPDGPPLILLAPKQATFQLERQLLGEAALPGYTRLQILSFERLAKFVFDQLEKPVPELLSEEGRVMVLRALLERKRHELRVFRASARLPGFARQLSQVLRELQNYHFTPATLAGIAQRIGPANRLDAKLHDLALVLGAYDEWLKQHQLEDGDRLLDLAAVALSKNFKSPISNLKFHGLWLDGFAQMTPQERQLLAATILNSDRTTLAFCLDGEPDPEAPWHSIWTSVGETVLRCRDEFRSLPGAAIHFEQLERNPEHNRFRGQPMLQHLERNWTKAEPFIAEGGRRKAEGGRRNGEPNAPEIRVVACANPEAEVELAAREIRRFVREENGRFRDCAVLLRSLDPYRDVIRRIFPRYEIPFFLDHRENVAHHPLAELTRYALRLEAYGWEHNDWFGALKTGLTDGNDDAVDRLENESLARGWRGRSFWQAPIPIAGTSGSGDWLEGIRRKVVAPFQQFAAAMGAAERSPTGAQLAAAIQELWRALKVDRKLDQWSHEVAETVHLGSNPPTTVHETVWEQMTEWLRNLELAFATETLPLNDWLPVIEAGLANLTIGVIPPAVDQVLVGAIDRSRNPDLELALVLGVNEGIFPSPPPPPPLLSRLDREELASHDAPLGPDFHEQIGLERYYGYIACTRARKHLVLTHARQDAEGRDLNPSPFLDDLFRLFPQLAKEEFSSLGDWKQAEHWTELIPFALRDRAGGPGSSWVKVAAELEPVMAKWKQVADSGSDGNLAPPLVEGLYGTELQTSVSGLEDFAACPFKFFVGRGLRAEERIEFEIDPREKGSFQHEVLREFHLRLERDGRRWRDLLPAEARRLVRETGEALTPGFREGLFAASPSRRFTAHLLIEGLEQLIETLVVWAKQYQFDPAVVETSFGLPESRLPAWRIDLDDRHALLLRGRIDRIDLCRIEATDRALAVVVDYKSSARELDKTLLHHGLELQLLAYLAALAQLKQFDEKQNLSQLIPAGAFYVALRGGGRSAKTRDEERAGRGQARTIGSQHRGRFDGGHLEKFDNRGGPKGDQFRFSKKQDGSWAARGNDALPSEEFQALIVRVEEFLRQHGRDIYAGTVKIHPFRWKNETACDFCLYRPICRFDPWTQPYRVLRPASTPEKTAPPRRGTGRKAIA